MACLFNKKPRFNHFSKVGMPTLDLVIPKFNMVNANSIRQEPLLWVGFNQVISHMAEDHLPFHMVWSKWVKCQPSFHVGIAFFFTIYNIYIYIYLIWQNEKQIQCGIFWKWKDIIFIPCKFFVLHSASLSLGTHKHMYVS